MYDYSKIDIKVESIINKVDSYMFHFDYNFIADEINKAYNFAKKAHDGQFRLSGMPYINHPVDATKILLQLKPDISTIQACLMHDVIEDTVKSYDDIKESFGEEVAYLCAGMEKLSKVRYRGEERSVGSLRKMFIAMAEDLRVIFIKLADRLHNMRTLKYHPKKEKRERIAMETLTIYAPIADRLGLFALKNSLEEECFKILHLQDYRRLKKELKELSDKSRAFVLNAKKLIDKELKGEISNYKVDFRVKSVYSIYKKMLRKGLTSAQSLHDLFGLRIIVEDVSDCYKVLGIIHNKWKPIPSRFKDYIALPKPNGYKSLHTIIIGLLKDHIKQPTEIQIKTNKMMEYADIGVAAHFEYKEKGSKIATDIDWVKDLKDLTDGLENNDFMASLKIDVFRDRIFVFTPKGDSINLPYGSTPVDFAYYLHTDLGDHISLAKVNSTVYPLDKELTNGDIVEIVIDKNKKPNPFWLSFIKTAKAKSKIKSSLRKENIDLHRDRGKEIMNNYLVKSGLDKFDKDLSILRVVDGKENNIEERWGILEQVGDFSVTPSALLKRIIRNQPGPKPGEQKKGDTGKSAANSSVKKHKDKVIIGNEEGMDYRLCYCCRRIVPEKIVAHINSKGIITVHRRDCKIISGVKKERILPAYKKGEGNKFSKVTLSFTFLNKIGVLKSLSEIIFSMGINIDEISSEKTTYDSATIILVLEIPEHDYLVIDRFIERVKIYFSDKLVEYKLRGITDLE